MKKIDNLFAFSLLLGTIFCMRVNAQQIVTPGGTTNTIYAAWLTPDTYSNGTWTNLIIGGSSVGNFSGAASAPVMNNTGGYNFHPMVTFNKTSNSAAPNQLYSQSSMGVSTTNSVTSIFVFQRSVSNINYDFIVGYSNSDNYTAIDWRSGSNNNLTLAWPGNTVTTSDINEGILAVSYPNAAFTQASGNGTRFYANGLRSNFQSWQWNGTSNLGNGQVALGGGRNDRAWYGYRGHIHEVILIKNSANAHVDPTDLRKIHTYLAIKYGITLDAGMGDYINSAAQVVWNRTTNANYNNNIFGIGRDDASGLYQKQSKSVNTDMLAAFVGNSISTLNSQNTGTLTNGQYTIFGDDNGRGINLYQHAAFAGFAGGTNNIDRINFRTAKMWWTQVTQNGVPSSSTVNLQVNYEYATHVIVSSNASFNIANTRIYPLVNKIAMNVLINHGDYVAFAGWAPSPGGIDLGANSYLLDVWIDGNNSTNATVSAKGVWKNLAPTSYSIEGYATNTPVVQSSSTFNFNRELNFNTSGSKLRTTTDYVRGLGESYYYFVASNATVGTLNSNNVLLSFNDASNNSTLRWHSSTSNILTANWTTNQRSPANFTSANFQRYGIATMNLVNANNGALNMYLNGSMNTNNINLTTGAANGPSSGSQRLIIGNARVAAGTNTDPFRGTIQEIILIRKTANAQMPQQQIEQIHSYLAIKYGITISHNYRNSNGAIVWDRTANAGYNNHIFGIARDDASGLYQKQSRSVTFRNLTAFTGNTISSLNSLNNGTLPDMQYLMIGSDGNAPILQLAVGDNFQHGNIYLNGDSIVSNMGINIKSGVFKTQLTGSSSTTVKLEAHSVDFLYALVSTATTFTTLNSKIYPVTNRITEVEIDTAFKYIRFIGFAPGPGGVSINLLMWLRADDDASLGIDYLSANTDTKLSGFTGFTDINEFSDRDAIPSVSVWKDMVRGHTYSWVAGDVNDANRRIPVYKSNPTELNFHPGVRFWAPNSNTGSYLGNASGVSDSVMPANGLTAIFLSNADFSYNSWGYMLAFGTANTNSNYNGPQYGVERSGSSGVGRYRHNTGNAIDGNVNLFDAGSTSIMLFKQMVNPSANYSVRFRFNGTEETRTIGTSVLGSFSVSAPSQLGKGYIYNRTHNGTMGEVIMYKGQLSDADVNKIESYLALKYSITLYPGNSLYPFAVSNPKAGTNRYNYRFSDGSTIWEGDVPSTDMANRKFVDFYNNIAAVIRDDAARLNNQHSHSTNVGSILHMGIAGTALTNDGRYTDNLENDLEAVVWGNNGATGMRPIVDDPCGDYDNIFNRIWMIHKITRDNRPIHMLVGAENNSALTIGEDTGVVPYYNSLTSGYNVYLVIANSPADMISNNFKAVIPMSFMYNQHQCNYVFTEEDTYITFAYRANDKGCEGSDSAIFNGLKTFDWTQYTSNTNRSTVHVARIPAASPQYFELDLGDNITVKTFVTYPSPVRATRGYPRAVNTPSRGSLELRRRNGSINSEVVVNMQFNNPVIPFFTISGIDGSSRSFDRLQLEGRCGLDGYVPTLSYASGPNNNTAYTIAGAGATAIRNTTMGATNLNGRMNVSFNGGVSEVTLKYRLNYRVYGTQRIFISPVSLRPVLPPPPLDEAGISFKQTAIPPEVSLCREVTYTYEIQNVNHADKKANFSVSLPAGMKWLTQSLALDSIYMDQHTFIHNYGETNVLTIDSLIIPCLKTAVFSVIAYFEDDAHPGTYTNRAVLEYELILHDTATHIIRESCDGLTSGCEPTTVTALPGERIEKLVIIDFGLDKTCYTAGDTINVTLQIRNPDAMPISDAALELFYNEEFTYIANSFNSDIPNAGATLSDMYDDMDTVSVPGGLLAREVGELIFLSQPIPSGYSNITFKLLAPNTLLQDFNESTLLFDESNFPLYIDLGVAFDFFTLSDNDCAPNVFYNAYGYEEIPAMPEVHITGPKHICINATSQLSRWTGGTWTSNNPSVATVNSATGEITAISDGTATFSFTLDNSGCVAVSETLTVHRLEISGQNIICTGSTTTLLANTNGIWSSSNPLIASITPTGTVTGVAVGTATMTFIDTVAFCTDTMTVTVTLLLPHSISISASDNNVCSGTQITFTAIPVNSGANPNYQWKKNGININGANASTYTYAPDHNDLITCEVTSNDACSTPTTVVSNGVTMIITPKVVPKIKINASSN